MSDHEKAESRYRLIFLLLLAIVASLFAYGCSGQSACPSGLHSYKDKCLTNMAIQFVGCTEGRGISPTTEISAGVGGTLKVVADASLTLAYKKSEQENTPVALQIVAGCMDIAKNSSPPDDQEQAVAASILKKWQDEVINRTPRVTLSRSRAKEGAKVTVEGSRFWPNEMVDIYVHATLISQVQADGEGRFSTEIRVPSSGLLPGFATTITATGRSSAGSAQAPFEKAP